MLGVRVALLSCTKSKKTYACSAKEMYSPSTLFSKALAYTSRRYEAIYVLSAKYGLLELDTVIEPYNLTLKSLSKQQKKIWAVKTFGMIEAKNLPTDSCLHFYAGVDYRVYLMKLLKSRGYIVDAPLQKMSFGKQLAFYTRIEKGGNACGR